MSRHQMGHADAAWLRMDRPTNLMVVTSVMWFDEPVDVETVRRVVLDRLVTRFPRFQQRVVEDDGLWWEDDASFDVDRHLHQVGLPNPAGRPELQLFVARLLTVPLDRSKPLWDLYLVDGYHGGSALVFRMHHCIADGIALARVMISLTDDPGADQVTIAPARESAGWDLGRHLAAAIREGAATLVHPTRVVDLANTALSDAAALAKLMLLLPDHRSSLRGPSGPNKAVAWSDAVPLSAVKATGHATGTTVNDVVLAAVAGGIRAHLERRGESVHDLRAIVPFNLRPLDQPLPADLGNMFGLVFVTLPVGAPNRVIRLQEMSRRTTAIKRSPEGAVAYGILQAVGQLPSFAEKAVVDLFAAKGTAVMTNVPGPRSAVTFGGHPVSGTIGWVPMSGDIGVGVSIFSYAGDLTIGLAVDTGLVPDVTELLGDITEELHAFLGARASSRDQH